MVQLILSDSHRLQAASKPWNYHWNHDTLWIWNKTEFVKYSSMWSQRWLICRCTEQSGDYVLETVARTLWLQTQTKANPATHIPTANARKHCERSNRTEINSNNNNNLYDLKLLVTSDIAQITALECVTNIAAPVWSVSFIRMGNYFVAIRLFIFGCTAPPFSDGPSLPIDYLTVVGSLHFYYYISLQFDGFQSTPQDIKCNSRSALATQSTAMKHICGP